MTGEARLISVIAPCYNEKAHVDAFCAAVAQQVLPPGMAMEVLIADGASDDGSRDVLRETSRRDPRFHLVDNPDRIVSCGLNRCLQVARGHIIVRMDLHTTYALDYIAQCVEALEASRADNVGGPWRAVADSGRSTQRAIAAAFQSRWLAGGARSRQLDFNGPVDTVYLGCWPRQTFERFGGFDEQLVRNQDDEHNLRITLGGGRIWQSSAIVSGYRPRGSLGALFRQYLQYGYWKPFVMRKHGRPASVRHVLPGLLLLLVCALLVGTSLGVSAWPLWGLAGTYGAFLLLAATRIAAAHSWRLWWRLPLVIAAYHTAYGLGSLMGWFDVSRGAVAGRGRFARITR